MQHAGYAAFIEPSSPIAFIQFHFQFEMDDCRGRDPSQIYILSCSFASNGVHFPLVSEFWAIYVGIQMSSVNTHSPTQSICCAVLGSSALCTYVVQCERPTFSLRFIVVWRETGNSSTSNFEIVIKFMCSHCAHSFETLILILKWERERERARWNTILSIRSYSASALMCATRSNWILSLTN